MFQELLQNSTLTIENGGVYDLQGGYLDVNTTIASGGQLIFDGGSTGPDPIWHSPSLNTQQTYNTQITLKNGGKVTSGGSEVIDNQTTFTQFDGTKYDQQTDDRQPDQHHQPSRAFTTFKGGTLTAGTIRSANSGGAFTQSGGQATVTGAANNLGVATIGAGGTFSVGGAYTNIGVTLLEGGTLQATGGVYVGGRRRVRRDRHGDRSRSSR